MKLLICNVGSTSLKYQLFDMDSGECVLASGGAERVGTEKSEFYWKDCLSGTTGREGLAFPSHKAVSYTHLSALMRLTTPSSPQLSLGMAIISRRNLVMSAS